MSLYARTENLLVEPMGHLWAAFSPACGETALLNDESASILEVLSAGPASTESVCAQLALDSGLAADSLLEAVTGGWAPLIEAGLVRRLAPDSPGDR